VAEVVSSRPIEHEDGDRDLVVPLVHGGEFLSPRTPLEALADARAHHERARAALPAEGWALSRGEPVLETVTD
jgi:nicotinate phosphoribosyltransferase